jgi:general secretion pathway protein K
LLVLWLAAALGAIGIGVATTVRAETDYTSTTADGLRAHYLATGSVDRAVQWMLWGPGVRNDDGSARFWDRSKAYFNMRYATGDVRVEIIPESSKLDVNAIQPEDLERLLTLLSGDARRAHDITEAILEWRGSVPPALDAYYLSLGPTFGSRHASIQEIEELLFVRGMTPELFYGNYVEDAQGRLSPRGGLRDCLSVWGTRYLLDANYASPVLLEALGMNPNDVARLVTARRLRPLETAEDLANVSLPVDRLRVGGTSMWTLRSTARLRRPDGLPSETVRSASAVVKYWSDFAIHPSQVQVLRYYDDAWSEFAQAPPSGGFLQ